MSHLVKNNKLLLKFLRLFFYIFILITIISGTYFYIGNKIIFLIFGLLSNLIFLVVFSKKTYFFEIFFGGLLWLGFWYKSLIIIIFDNYNFREGAGIFKNFDYNNQIQILDNSFATTCYGLAGFLLACLIKNTLLNNFYNLKKNFQKNNKFLNIKILKFLLLIFIITYLTITYSNFSLGIYQRGILPTYNTHFFISAIYKWLLLFGFISFIAFIFIFTFKSKLKIYLLSITSIVETFISNLSFLSRGMIFNLFAIFIGLYKSNKFYDLKINIKFFLIYLLSIIFFFYLSVLTVNYLRANIFFIKQDSKKTFQSDEISDLGMVKKYSTIKTGTKEFLSISINRWVGIDAMVAVESFEEKSFAFFKQSFADKFDKNKYPYYEKNIQKRVKSRDNSIRYGITTPGIFAFSYYTGSQVFVFITIFLVSILLLTFEKLIFLIFNNLILCSVMSQVLAYRLIHFGYMPQNTYMLLTSILITIMGLFLLKKLLEKD
jgi:hypothetical protein